MQINGFFHHARVDVGPTAEDEILNPVHKKKVTFVIHVADISSTKPAVTQTIGIFFGSIQVAAHDLRALNPYLATFTNAERIVRRF